MPETALMIPVGNSEVEARLATGTLGKLVVICHPHPQYGGSMDNNVVLTARDCLIQAGFSTLRFNFRGVGRNHGTPDTGADVDELAALLEYMARQEDAARGLHVAAYSYGAWVALSAVRKGAAPASMLLFSPPIDFMPFDEVRLPEAPCLITLGSRDDYCSESSLRQWLALHETPESSCRVVVLPGGDHFYTGQETALTRAIRDFIPC